MTKQKLLLDYFIGKNTMVRKLCQLVRLWFTSHCCKDFFLCSQALSYGVRSFSYLNSKV